MSHTYYSILAHCVFSTKERRRFLREASLRESLHAYLAQFPNNWKMTFQEEVRALLRKHNLEWDERYVWD